jgi:hypothetical protein
VANNDILRNFLIGRQLKYRDKILQEDNPYLIGEELAKWYLGI